MIRLESQHSHFTWSLYCDTSQWKRCQTVMKFQVQCPTLNCRFTFKKKWTQVIGLYYDKLMPTGKTLQEILFWVLYFGQSSHTHNWILQVTGSFNNSWTGLEWVKFCVIESWNVCVLATYRYICSWSNFELKGNLPLALSSYLFVSHLVVRFNSINGQNQKYTAWCQMLPFVLWSW